MGLMSIAESPWMLVMCSIVIVYVVIQSVLFMRRAWKRGLEIGLSPSQMKRTITGSATFSIVPSIPILIILVMLMSALGRYFPWLRLSVIGSSSYESVAATVTARSFGLSSYVDPAFSGSMFLSAIWAMTIVIASEPLLVVFGLKSLDKGLGKVRDTKPVFFGLLVNGIFIAMMGWFCATYLTYWTEDFSQVLSLVALLVAAGSALLFMYLSKKTGKKMLNELAFPCGMIIGMVGAYLGNAIIF